MCVGQPLKNLSENKVSFPSPDRKIARGPWQGEVPMGNQMVPNKEAWSPSTLSPQSLDFWSIPLPSFNSGRDSGRGGGGEPFVLSPPTCSQFGQIQTKRGEPCVDVKRALSPLKKNDSRPWDASATIMCHFLQLILVPWGPSTIDLLFPLSGRKSQQLQPSAVGGCMASWLGQKEVSPWEVKDSSQQLILMQDGS